ncbi:DNA-binding NarL/FixJ family response regulator [Metabacillus crassostreae]|uniref:Myb-like DNA-binding domain-containing protein n=1 Tax=Metabacillus crassostreae TaxID=929098 RepID=UPI00195948BC|nr:Myb-like DNA-binding domain-containing protein [Metabacillus crassostreae]MBM7606252.1 DNA-binding NarL/FixJ family response regulator [Metabacillus crassostreae]
MSITSNNTLQTSEEEVKRTYRHWTTLEDRKLLQLRASGLKFKTIAEQLNRTPISVEKRYRKILKNN